MRKLLLLALVVLLASTALSVSAFDDPDMTALASYFSDDALLYMSVRVDDSLVESLDSLLGRVTPFLPQGTLPPNITANDLLDLALQDADLGSFDETIRPWLGDVAALGMYQPESLYDDPPVLVAVDVDGEAALTFFSEIIANELQSGSLEQSEVNGYTVFTSTSEYDTTEVAIGDDVLFIASMPNLLPLEGIENPLSDDSNFHDTLNSLPEDSYGLLMYANMQQLQQFNLAQAGLVGASGMPSFLEDFMDVYGGTAIGFTILNEEALVMDVVQNLNIDAYDEFGVDMATMGAIDTAFTNHIPSNAFAVVQSADFGSSLQLGLDNVRALGDYIKANGGLADMIDPEGYEFDEEERLIINQVDLAWFVGFVNFTFAGGTGLNLERDVLPVLDGDIAMFVSASPAESFISPILPDAALLFQNSDADAAVAIVEQLGASAEAYELPVFLEDYSSGTAIVLPAEEFLGFSSPSLDILVGASDDVFAIGTRGGVNAVVDMDESLVDNSVYQDASQYFIPDTQQLLYLATDPILDAADVLISGGDVPLGQMELQMGYPAISLLESASITGAVDENGVTTIRLVITLAEEPRPLPVVPDA